MTSQDDSMTRQDELEQDAKKLGVSRRQFLTAGSAAIATLAIPARANADSTSSQLPSQEILGPAVRSYSSKPAASQVSARSLQPFQQPELWNPKDQKLPDKLPDLVAQEEILEKYPGGDSPIKLRSYNGHIPGPTLYLNAGEQINFTLCNNLNPRDNNDAHQNLSAETQEACTPFVISNVPNCFSTTNMHFHGFHVSPKTNKETDISSDDVTVDIYPNQTRSYSVQVPSNHAPGTHWYHSHRHGSTGIQVSNGMAGALIIKEPSGQEIVKEDQDIVWLIQELNSLGNADANDSTIPNYAGSGVYGIGKDVAKTSTFIVNAVLQPVIKMETGTMQRWRLINATSTPAGFMQLVLCKCSDDPEASCDKSTTYNDADRCPMHLIAVDGISFYGQKPYQYPCNPQDNNLLVNLYDPTTGNFQFSPGNRADFLILLPQEGMYKLIKQSYKTEDGKIVGGSGAGVERSTQVLAYIQVTKGDGSDAIPPIVTGESSQYPYLKPIADADIVKPTLPNNPTINDLSLCPTPPDSFIPDLINNKRIFVFQACTTDTQNRQFVIDEQLFDTHSQDESDTVVTATLGTAEEWILDNQAGNVFGPRGQSAPHPFHIHINPFQVVATGTKNGNTITWSPVNNPIWRDTVAVEPNLPLKIRHRFDDFDGLFVMHCHILLHEDQGMMYMVNIEDKSQTA